jgi:hypothetical protein
MIDSTYALLIVNTLWSLAVYLYYWAGKRRGYADGYIDGVKEGHRNALTMLDAGSSYLQDAK